MKWTLCFLMVIAPLAAWAADGDAPEKADGQTVNPLIASEGILKTIKAIETHLDEVEKSGPAEQGIARDPMALNVRKCVSIALERNAKALVAEADLDAARARIGQARSQMFPQMTGRVGFSHTEYAERNPGGGLLGLFEKVSGAETRDATGAITVPSAIFGVASSLITSQLMEGFVPNTVPDDDLRRDELSVRQVLYAGGQIRAGIRASRYLAESQEWQQAVTLDAIEYDAKEAYYDTLLAGALTQVADESVKTFERNLSDAQQKLDVGMISNFEVLRAKTEVGARKADAVAAKNARRLSEANLRRILFIPEGTPVDLEPDLEWAPIAKPVEAFVAYAFEWRPELQALEKGIEAQGQNLRRVKGQFRPSVAATADYSNTDRGSLAIPDGWTFAIGGEWEIYAGGRRKHEVAEAKAELRSLEDQLADVERLVEFDVTQSYIRIQDAMAKIKSERGTVDLAREGLRLAELRFQEGVGTQSETLDAELAQTNAETSLFLAIRDYAVANAALEKATGKSWVRKGPGPVIAEGAPAQ